MIAEREDTGEVVGMAMTFPDINQVLARMKGAGCCRWGGGTSCGKGFHHGSRARGLAWGQA